MSNGLPARFEFFAQGHPKGQPRAKACAFAGRARLYDPGTADDWKTCVKRAAHDAGLTNAMLEGPLSVSIRLVFARPKAHFRAGKNSHLLRLDAPTHHTSKPDRDNADKAILDALTDACVWRDDCQVCDGPVSKIYGAAPGAHIVIELLR